MTISGVYRERENIWWAAVLWMKVMLEENRQLWVDGKVTVGQIVANVLQWTHKCRLLNKKGSLVN